MSTSFEHTQSTTRLSFSRRQLWSLAMLSPVMLLPAWFNSSEVTCGGVILVLLLTCATITDLSRRKIYNWATYPAFLWAVLMNFVIAPGPSNSGVIGFSASLIGAAVCLGIMLVPYALARGGAGDVKLAVAIGALLGVDDGVLVIASTYIIAGVAIAGWAVWHHGPLTLLGAMLRRFGATFFPSRITQPSQQQSRLLDKPIPLAGFFAIATIVVECNVLQVLRSL